MGPASLLIPWLFLGCIPRSETYRPEARVVTSGNQRVDQIVACTWSSWYPLTGGCDDRVVGTLGPAGWHFPWFGNPYFTPLIGEAPLMHTLFVACQGAAPLGATFQSWSEPWPTGPVVIVLDGIDGISGTYAPDADVLANVFPRLCAGDPTMVAHPTSP